MVPETKGRSLEEMDEVGLDFLFLRVLFLVDRSKVELTLGLKDPVDG